MLEVLPYIGHLTEQSLVALVEGTPVCTTVCSCGKEEKQCSVACLWCVSVT